MQNGSLLPIAAFPTPTPNYQQTVDIKDKCRGGGAFCRVITIGDYLGSNNSSHLMSPWQPEVWGWNKQPASHCDLWPWLIVLGVFLNLLFSFWHLVQLNLILSINWWAQTLHAYQGGVSQCDKWPPMPISRAPPETYWNSSDLWILASTPCDFYALKFGDYSPKGIREQWFPNDATQ